MDTEKAVLLKMEYYSVTKNKDIMKFVGKWLQEETIILSEVTQTQKAMHVCTYLQINITHKVMDIHSTPDRPQNAKLGSSKCA